MSPTSCEGPDQEQTWCSWDHSLYMVPAWPWTQGPFCSWDREKGRSSSNQPVLFHWGYNGEMEPSLELARRPMSPKFRSNHRGSQMALQGQMKKPLQWGDKDTESIISLPQAPRKQWMGWEGCLYLLSLLFSSFTIQHSVHPSKAKVDFVGFFFQLWFFLLFQERFTVILSL